MIGMSPFVKFHAMKETAKKAGPAIEVSEKQMLKLFKATGMSEAKAQMQMTIQKVVRSEVLIGNKLFKLKESKNEGQSLEARKQKKTSKRKGNKKSSKKT